MSNPTVGIDIVARLDQFKAELAKIPDIGGAEARSLTAKLSKEIKAAEAASKKAMQASQRSAEGARDAMNGAAAAADKFGDKAGKVGSSAGKLAGALDLLGSGAGGAARTVADLADVGEVAAGASSALGVGLGTVGSVAVGVGAALLPLAGHLAVVAREEAEAAARAEFLRKHMYDLVEVTRSATDAAVAKRVAEGKVSEEEAYRIQLQEKTNRAKHDYAKTLAEERRAAELAFEQSEREIQRWSALGDTLQTTANHYAGFTSKRAEAEIVLSRLDQLEREYEDTLVREQEALWGAYQATKKKKDADEEAKKAAQDAAEAKRKQDEAEAESAKRAAAARERQARRAREAAEAERQAAEAAAKARAEAEEANRAAIATAKDYWTSLDKLRAMAEASAESRLTGEEKVASTLKKALKEIEAEQRRAWIAAGDSTTKQQLADEAAAAARVEAEQIAADEIAKIRNEAREKQKAQEEQDRQQREQDAEKEIALRRQVASEASGLFGTMSEAAGMLAEEQGKTNQEAAMQTYKVQKALGITEALINTAVAVSEALTLGPAAVFAVPAAAAAGAMQVAAIASTPPPSFNDTPGVQQMSTRGMVSLASGDYFAAAREPGELRRQVGAMSDTRPQVLEVRLGHRVLDRTVARTLRQGGRTARQIERMTGASVYGHSA
jgi:hypothetical protein